MNTEVFTKNNKFLMLALDHRESIKKLFNPQKPDAVPAQEIIEFKAGIIKALADQFSALLIDPEYGLPAFKQVFEGAEKKPPYLLCMEKTGFREKEGSRYSELQYPASKIKELGAAGAKLLIYFNPLSLSAPAQLELSQGALAQAHKENLPFFLEIVTYELKDKTVPLSEMVLKSLEMFLEGNIMPDVFKLEYPADLASCRKITQMVGARPWILLTRGERFDVFRNQLKDAVAGGASGFLAGRAIWQEATNYKDAEREKFFQGEVKKRFQEISKIAVSGGPRSLTDFN